MSLKKKLSYLNINNVDSFVAIHLFTTLLVFIFFLIVSPYNFIVAPIAGIIYYYLFVKILVDYKVRDLARSYEYDSIVFFDSFLLFLKNGFSIREAIIKTCNVLDNDLSKLVLSKIQSSKNTLDEKLNSVIEVMPSELVCNMFMEVIFAYKNGNHLGDSIGMQIECIKDKYNRNVINYYRYIPVKIGVLCLLVMVFMALLLVIST